MRALMAGLLALPLAAGCGGDSDLGWVAFSSEGESLVIEVIDGPPADDAALRDLTSTTGSVIVGTATVEPARGPVGTEHQVTVAVDDEYEEVVRRVTLETEGDRGSQRHLLVRDSADLGLWRVDVISLGTEGETRQDTFTFRLWRPAEEDEEPDTGAEVEEEGG